MNKAEYLRRQPQQARGQQRVDAILDAAEVVFAEMGYAAATTNAIAARANTNISSLYQFFPNKEAILVGIVTRYREEYDALTEIVFSGDWRAIPLTGLIDRMADAIIVLHARHGVPRPFFVGVGGMPGGFAAGELANIEQEVYGGLLQRGDQALALHAPHLDPSQRYLALQVILRTTQALIHLADLAPGAEKVQVVAGMKTMLHAYLDSLRAGE